ncbi:MAG TPA: AMP-binding protein [Kofleriaceae bacterium]|nr:AMP-binding protein [Kofleriaceae bacterium]
MDERTRQDPSAPPPAWAGHLPPGTDPRSIDLLAEGSLVRAWARRWTENRDRPVVHAPGRGWLTAADLERESRRVAGRLHAAGLRRGDRVLVSAASSAALVTAHAGALRLGLVVVPASTGYREREIAHVVRDAEPRAALIDREEARAWVRAADPRVVIAGPEVALPDGPAAPPGLDEATAGDPALICYTSGTTGAPKGAVLSHGNALASAEAVRLAWRWSEADRLVLALPLFHVHGLAVGLHGTLLAGGSAVLLPSFGADAVLDAARDHAATMFFGVPTMYARLAASPRLAELGRLRLCVSGSAPLQPQLFERIAAAAGQRILERYGMSETLMNISNPHDGERRPGSVGLPLPGVEVALAEPGGGAPEPDRAEGEILLRGPNVFSGYWRNPEATAAAFTGPYFRSGDIGARAADGTYSIVGRCKELIISGGYNVYPREVEEVLLAHPAVAEVAVAGTPSDEWGETVTAYIVPRGPAPDPAELTAFADARLAAYKRPRIVHFVPALPRNALGKVVRGALAGLIQS